MKRILSIFLCAIFATLNVNVIPAVAREYDFSDVSPSHWAYDTIMQLSDQGVIDGFEDNTFNPNGDVTREQFIKLLVCATENVEEDVSINNISDINEDRWSYIYIANADDSGVINADDYADGFNAQGLMNRAVAVKWISKAISVSNNDIQTGIFNDITNNDTDAYASELYAYGIINGYEDGGFHPDDAMSRAEAATIIKNITDYLATWEISDEEKEIIDYADNVLTLDTERNTNLLSKNSETLCEFTNADNDIKSLKKGDIFVVPNCEQAPGGMAVKVDKITVKDKTITITKDKNISLEEIVDKIDINKKADLKAENIIIDELPKGVTVADNRSYSIADNNFNQENVTASLDNAVSLAADIKAKDNGFTINLSDEFKPMDGVSVTGELNIDGIVHPEIQYDKKLWGVIKHPNATVDMDVDILSKLTVETSGEIEDKQIMEIPFEIPFETFSVFVKIILKVGADGKAVVTTSCDIHNSGTLKYRPTLEKLTPEYRNKEFSIKPDIEAEMSVTITPKFFFRTGVAFLGLDDDESVFSIFIDPEYGQHITVGINSKAQNHIHKPCLNISFQKYIMIGAGLGFMGEDIKNWDIWNYDFKSSDYYAGRADEWEFGIGSCPYLEDDSQSHTYTTNSGTAFDYSDNWKITNEEVNPTGNILEWVTLTNDRGVEINYIQHGNLRGGRIITEYEVTKAADSQFIPGYIQGKDYSLLGNFMVGRIKGVGEYDMMTGELIPHDGGVNYAVLPESFIGSQQVTGSLGGWQDHFSFCDGIIFYANSPDGSFTEEDEQEVIQILSTFRVE